LENFNALTEEEVLKPVSELCGEKYVIELNYTT
jgi:hypothetical protein